MTDILDIQKIKSYLPHRYPFLLVDKVISYEVGDSLKAVKNITFTESCFQGHFPDRPIYPGVLIIETMAQAAALLGCITIEEKPRAGAQYYLAGIDKARFRRKVYPGDQIVVNVELKRIRRNVGKFFTTALVDDMPVASAEILTTIIDSDFD